MAIGVFGGTFDPIHLGHLLLAQEMGEALRLSRILLVPAGQPPHKGEPDTPYRHRLGLVRRAVAGSSLLEASDLEGSRPGPSYTVDTLRALEARSQEAGGLVLLVGGDTALELATWKEPREILRRAHLGIGLRPGSPGETAEAVRQGLERQLGLQPGDYTLVPTTAVSLASRDLRRRAAAGLPLTYRVLPAVEAYIREHSLYSPREESGPRH